MFGTHDGWRHFEIDDGGDYAESFFDLGAPLNGSNEDLRRATWSASSPFASNGYINYDGSDLAASGSALLPFSAAANSIYELSVRLRSTASDWVALGFTELPVDAPGESALDDVFFSKRARAWAAFRDSADDTEDIELFAGPNTVGQIADSDVPVAFSQFNTFRIVLDTHGDGSSYTIDYQLDQGIGFESLVAGGEPVIVHDSIANLKYVGLSYHSGANTPPFSVRIDDFRLEKRTTATITDLTLTGGDSGDVGGAIHNGEQLLLRRSKVSGNSASFSGGGVFNGYSARGTVTDSILSGNSAGTGGGLANYHAVTVANSTLLDNTARFDGGGFMNRGTATITDSQLDGNSSFNGGAIINFGGFSGRDGELILAGSTLSGNASGSVGGGLYNLGKATVTQSTFTDNSSEVGGGIATLGPGMTVGSSTFSGNSAGHAGGGLANAGFASVLGSTFLNNSAGMFGGGLSNGASGGLTVVNSTASGNTAGFGGGLANYGTAAIVNSTLSENESDTGGGLANHERATAVIANTIVANSVRGGDVYAAGEFFGNYNLVEDGSDGLPDTITGDPRLGPLRRQRRAHTDARPAARQPGPLDAGDPAAVVDEFVLLGSLATDWPEHDQRGAPFSRIENGRIDIGAFEGVASAPTPGDANLDGVVDLLDLDRLGAHFGIAGAYFSLGDFNGDHIVDLLDLDLLGAHYETRVPAVTSGIDDTIAAIDAALDLIEAGGRASRRRRRPWPRHRRGRRQ